MDKSKMLSAMAERTGLKRETIKDLMKNGWFYEEVDRKASFSKKVKL